MVVGIRCAKAWQRGPEEGNTVGILRRICPGCRSVSTGYSVAAPVRMGILGTKGILLMKTIVYYFSGTGNSMAVAKQVAAGLGNTDIVSIADNSATAAALQADRIGLVFPVIIWGVAPAMVRFLRTVSIPSGAYVFAIATCGGEGCSTVKQVRRILRQKGQTLHAGFEVKMVNNYIPLGIPTPEEQQRLLSKAKDRIFGIIEAVKRKERVTHTGWIFLNWLLSGIVYRQCARWFPVMDKSFRPDENCNGCGMCQKVCPANNIAMQDNKPVWLHHCDQCWACLHWCPRHAIQSGKSSINRRRYHHPDVSMTEIIRSTSH
jgi:ferredoxin/flavodoxin